MIKRKRLTLPAVLIAIILMLTGCTTFDNFKAAYIDKPQDKSTIITIGVYEPLSGSDKESAELEIQGIELANKLYPNVNGKLIQLEYADNCSDIDVAQTAIETLISKSPIVVLGSYNSIYSLAAGEALNEAKIPAIAATNTNPLVTSINDYYFRVCYEDSDQGDFLARYVLEQKKEKKAGVILPEGDDAAFALAVSFMDRIKGDTDDDDSIAVYAQYKPGTEDFTEQLEEVEKAGITSVLLPGDSIDCANIIKQALNMGLNVQFLGDESWSDDSFAEAIGLAASREHVAFTQSFSTSSEGDMKAVEEIKSQFQDAYAEEYGDDEPDENVALGFDSYIIAYQALDMTGADATSEDIQAAMSNGANSFIGATGKISFDNNGDPIETAYINTWSFGSIETICVIEPGQ